MSGRFSVDYDTATSNSSKMAAASDDYASPAASSVGSVTADCSAPATLDACIRTADERMYARKAERKARQRAREIDRGQE